MRREPSADTPDPIAALAEALRDEFGIWCEAGEIDEVAWDVIASRLMSERLAGWALVRTEDVARAHEQGLAEGRDNRDFWIDQWQRARVDVARLVDLLAPMLFVLDNQYARRLEDYPKRYRLHKRYREQALAALAATSPGEREGS